MTTAEERLAAIGQGVVVAASRRWNPALHPRARNGRFIEKGGWIRALFDFTDGAERLNGRVLGFADNPASRDDPLVIAATKRGELRTPVSRVQQAAPPKGTLTKQAAERLGLDLGGFKKAEETYEQKMARRTQMVERINAAAEELSTTDPAERSKGLNKILSGLRGTPVSTVYEWNKRGRSHDEWDAHRVAQHEALWEGFIAKVDAAGVPKDRKALALGGLPGAGKSFSLRPGGAAEELGVVAWDGLGDPPEGVTHVSLNPDSIKEMMIEAGMLPSDISPKIKPMEQVAFIHAESNFLVSLFFQRLAGDGYNVVYDTTMANVPHVKKNLGPMRENDYSFQGLFVDIDYTESRISATKRYVEDFATPQGGRFVPSEAGSSPSSRGFRSANRDVFQDMTPWFTDGWLVIDNSGVADGNPKREVVARGVGEDRDLRERRRRQEAEREARRQAKATEDFKKRQAPGGPSNQSAADFLKQREDRGMRGAAAQPGPLPWPVLVWDLRQGNIDPEEGLERLRSGGYYVPDHAEVEEDSTWEDETDAYSAASTIPHELIAIGAEDYLDEYAAEVERWRAEGRTMSAFIESLPPIEPD